MKFFHLLRVEGQKVEAACSSKIRLKVHLGVRLAPDPVVSPVLCDERVPARRWRRPLIVTHLVSELEFENFCRAILSYSWLSLHKQTRHADFGLPAPLAEGLWMLVVRGGLLTPAREPWSIVGQKAMCASKWTGQPHEITT